VARLAETMVASAVPDAGVEVGVRRMDNDHVLEGLGVLAVLLLWGMGAAMGIAFFRILGGCQ
jgi:hypothetical protein